MKSSNSNLFFLIIIATPFLLSCLFAINCFKFSKTPPFTNSSSSTYDDKFNPLEVVPFEGAVGPESFDFDALGRGPYSGVSGGRIIRWLEVENRWTNFAVTSPLREECEGREDQVEREHICGRPLGLRFHNPTGDLYIADAYMGLLKVGPQGGLATPVATEAEGIPFRFCNGVDIDQSNGVVYFTDSSTRYHRRYYFSAILSGERTGRLMKYDLKRRQVTVLLRNLSFPNGLALSHDGDYLLLTDTINCRILKYYLRTSKAGTLEFLAQLPGFPDNIKMSPRGGFWVGIYSKRQKLSELVMSYPWIGRFLLKLPIDIMKIHEKLGKVTGNGGMAVRLSDEDGSVLEVLEDSNGRLRSVSEVMEEENGKLWIGSVNMPYAGIYKT